MKPQKLISDNSGHYTLHFAGDEGAIYDFHLDPDTSSIKNCSQPDWRHTFGENAATALEECITAFEQSKKSMNVELGAVKLVGIEASVPVKNREMTPRSIEAESSGSKVPTVYHVSFDCHGEPVNHTFRIRADDLASIGIDWDEPFWINIDGELSIARPLFEAISAFYKFGIHMQGGSSCK